MAVYDSSILTSDKVNEKYADVPPLLVIEVDIKVELEGDGDAENDFVTLKTQSLLDHGAGKVIWLLTKERQIILAEKNQDWQTIGISDNFELISGLTANAGEYLTKRKIKF